MLIYAVMFWWLDLPSKMALIILDLDKAYWQMQIWTSHERLVTEMSFDRNVDLIKRFVTGQPFCL